MAETREAAGKCSAAQRTGVAGVAGVAGALVAVVAVDDDPRTTSAAEGIGVAAT